ncbi:MAG: hypothetical protein ABIJ65_10170, partial [Chloroflexota bacterium]
TKRVFFLGKGYRTDKGGEELYALSVEAYEKCLALKPQDAQWHAGFADLLSNRAFWDSWTYGVTRDAKRSIQEIHTALQLAPTDPIVLNIAQNISSFFPGSLLQVNGIYDFPWLTQTPTPLAATATIAAGFDPFSVSGEYSSELLLLGNQRKMQMNVRLQSDHTAYFECKYDDGQYILANGNWVDNGDGSIRIFVRESYYQSYVINFLYVDTKLIAVDYPLIFSGADWELKRILMETPSLQTSEITSVTVQPARIATQETTTSTNPICGNTLFVPFGLVILLALSSKATKREEINYDRKRQIKR